MLLSKENWQQAFVMRIAGLFISSSCPSSSAERRSHVALCGVGKFCRPPALSLSGRMPLLGPAAGCFAPAEIDLSLQGVENIPNQPVCRGRKAAFHRGRQQHPRYFDQDYLMSPADDHAVASSRGSIYFSFTSALQLIFMSPSGALHMLRFRRIAPI